MICDLSSRAQRAGRPIGHFIHELEIDFLYRFQVLMLILVANYVRPFEPMGG